MWRTTLYAFILFCGCTFASNVEYDGHVLITLEHGLDGTERPEFTERGNITITSLKLGTWNVQQMITAEDKNKIRDLARRNKFYQLRATVHANDGEQTYTSVVKACMLAEAELSDIITITLDYTGKILTITESIASTSTCQGSDIPLDKLKEFSTNVYVRHTHSGPGPDTASYIQKLEREREAKEKGEAKDQRSFLAKYWMYIVPVVLVMVLSSAANPEAAAGAGR